MTLKRACFQAILPLYALALSACAQPTDGAAPAAAPEAARPADVLTHEHARALTLARPADHLSDEGLLRWADALPFAQLGLMFDAPEGVEALRARTQRLDGTWTAWTPLEITWSEGARHVARLLLSETAQAIEIDGAASMTWAHLEVHATQQVHPDAPLTRALPTARQRVQAVAPASLVISRADWGARDPGKICNNIVTPYRVSLHHTASPSTDGPDPAERLRQMQAFHIDTRGWCDIGYHFVVSQSGKIYQGRSDERRPGAHVGDQNNGNIGISLIGNYEETEPPEAQLDAVVNMLRWIRETYSITWTREFVKGHREWPGQATACPGKNVLSKLDTLLADSGSPADPAKLDVRLTAKTLGGEDRHKQGESAGVIDLFAGEEAQVEVKLTNATSGPLRGVQLGYSIDSAHVQGTSYTITTDAPALDGATWMINDADAAPENPAKDALGSGGTLTMYAFGAGETKRVVFDLRALKYSLGESKPAVRVWVKQIDEVYAQDGWAADPTLNTTASARLRASGRADVLSKDAWFWDSGDGDDTESWAACDAIDQLAQNAEDGLMTARVTGATSCAQSPAWTSLNADTWDQLVISLRAHDGPHTAALSWRRAGEQAWHMGVFDAAGNSELETLVLDMSAHPEWRGKLDALRWHPLHDAAPGPDDMGWYGLDLLYPQSSTTQRAATPRRPFLDQTPTAIRQVDPGADPGDPTDPSDPTDPNNPNNPGDPGDPGDGDPGQTDGDVVTVNSGGCATSPGQPLPAPLGVLVMLGIGAVVRLKPHPRRAI